MIEIEIPKDIRQYEAKLVGPFTTRQTIFFVCGCVLGIPVFKIVNAYATMDLAAFACMLITAPFLAFGWVKIYGMQLEKFLKTAFISNVLSPKKRKYKTINSFENFFEEPPQKTVKRKKKPPKSKNPDLQGYF